MIIICGKTYYNLEEAVRRLTELIGRSTDVVKQIRGQAETVDDLPDAASVNIGDTYAVGLASPFNYYVALADGWLNLGEFPMQGDPGADGENGASIWYSTTESDVTLTTVRINTIYNPDDLPIKSGDLLITPPGDLYSITAVGDDIVTVSYRFMIKGEKGDTGTSITEFTLAGLAASDMPTYDVAADANTLIMYADTAYRYYNASLIPGTGYREIVYTATSPGSENKLTLRYSTSDNSAISVTATSKAAQDTIGSIDLLGTVTGATYDTTDGINVTGSGTIISAAGETQNITAEISLPIFPGDNVTIDANDDGKGIVIKSEGGSSATIFELAGLTASDMPAYDVANSAGTIILYNGYFYTNAGQEGDGVGSWTLQYVCVTAFNDRQMYADVLTLQYHPVTKVASSIQNVFSVVGARAITPSEATASATSGTLTAGEYHLLTGTDSNYILFNNECYYLADKEHTAGMLTYVHNGYNGDTGTIKYFNITVSTRAWTLTSYTPGGGSASGTVPVVESIDDPISTSDTFVQYNGAIYCLVEE